MRSPRFIKLSGVVLVIALLALFIGVQQSTMAGPLPQATAASAATAAASVAATSGAAATVAGTMTFPPCPPATSAATSQAASATAAASMAATGVPNPGYLGVRVEAVDACGVRVLEVLPNSPASTASIQVQDIIVGINGTQVTGINQARQAIESSAPGTTVQLTIQRGSSQMTISVTLAAQPAGGAAGATLAATSGTTGGTTGGAGATTAATP